MDSTWKTNALGYGLYRFVAEANGQSLSIAFAFTTMVNNRAAPGAKTRLIEQVLSHIGKRCPDIAFALTDKDISKINAVKEVLPSVKNQLCYWHVLRYLDDRMADNKPPRKYDASYAHSRFRFIDKKWIPDTVSPLDNELEDAFEPTQRGQQKLDYDLLMGGVDEADERGGGVEEEEDYAFYTKAEIQTYQAGSEVILKEMRRGTMDVKHKKMLDTVILEQQRCVRAWDEDDRRKKALNTYQHSKYTMHRQR
ncbi:hypothetical protein NCC49_005297 [Naganishia albida]|nr:hypothetical protein NCC49_005297 [Naganishia albida]